MTRTIMLQGTASNVGKSILTTALCKIFSRNGYKVAPFKSWNMALNSYVTPDGGEVGRAQAIQADAAETKLQVEMQPILVKPKGKGKSQVIVKGKPIGDVSLEQKNNEYVNWAMEVIEEALTSLTSDFEVVVIEGAGSPAEINIKDQDLANMKVAKLNQTPVLLVADIDRGGALASVVGTLKLLSKEERKLVKGIILNKFRGDYELLKPGIEVLEEKTGKPVVGVIPYLKEFKIPDEDSVSLSNLSNPEAEVRIGVIKLPHISNFTDFDDLALETGVEINYLDHKTKLKGHDALIIPGTKNTTADLTYLKQSGLADKIIKLAKQDIPTIGICGGYQMLGRKLYDPQLTEGSREELEGLGLLDLETTFNADKHTHQASAVIERPTSFFSSLKGKRVTGYEIHMGETKLGMEVEPIFRLISRSGEKVDILEGACDRQGSIWGTYLHGIFKNDRFRREFINDLRRKKGLSRLTNDYISSRDKLERNYQQLADIVEENLDLELLTEILREGAL